jgi:hypothetical protein
VDKPSDSRLFVLLSVALNKSLLRLQALCAEDDDDEERKGEEIAGVDVEMKMTTRLAVQPLYLRQCGQVRHLTQLCLS